MSEKVERQFHHHFLKKNLEKSKLLMTSIAIILNFYVLPEMQLKSIRWKRTGELLSFLPVFL